MRSVQVKVSHSFASRSFSIHAMRFTYGECYIEPVVRVRVKLENFMIAIFAPEATVYDDILACCNGSSVMGNATWASAGSVYLLPLEVCLIVVLFHHLVDFGQVEAPHRGNGTLLQVTASMNIQAIEN